MAIHYKNVVLVVQLQSLQMCWEHTSLVVEDLVVHISFTCCPYSVVLRSIMSPCSRESQPPVNYQGGMDSQAALQHPNTVLVLACSEPTIWFNFLPLSPTNFWSLGILVTFVLSTFHTLHGSLMLYFRMTSLMYCQNQSKADCCVRALALF